MPGTLVFVRHGMSEYNKKKLFTGWIDADLAPEGFEEAHKGGQKLKGYHFDMAFTSVLMRATKTLDIILQEIEQTDIPITRDEALNERHYGDLQGKNKDEVRQEVGDEQVHIWRRSFNVAPPNGESLKDTCARTIPYFEKHILPELKAGKNVIIAAHGNSLRSIVKDLEHLSEEEIVTVEIPTGVPYIYEFDDDMNIINKTILDSDHVDDEEHEVQ